MFCLLYLNINMSDCFTSFEYFDAPHTCAEFSSWALYWKQTSTLLSPEEDPRECKTDPEATELATSPRLSKTCDLTLDFAIGA